MSVIAKDKEWLKGRNKYRTGYCLNNQCEGTRPKTYKGDPQPTCRWWDTCPCDCHKILDDMYEIAKRERALVDNPEYVPDRGDFVWPDPDEILPANALNGRGGTGAHDGAVDPSTPGVRVAGGRAYVPTASGYKASGQLEGEVLDVVLAKRGFIDGGIAFTMKMISDMIAKSTNLDPPSVGAIQAVLTRWQGLDLVRLGTKPVSLEWVAPDLSVEVLQKAKNARKRENRANMMSRRRGFRTK